MAPLCHPWFTTTNLSYRFPIFETSATALCGTIGINYKYNLAHVVHSCWCVSFLPGLTTRSSLGSWRSLERVLRSRPTNWQRNSFLDLCCCSPATSASKWWFHMAWHGLRRCAVLCTGARCEKYWNHQGYVKRITHIHRMRCSKCLAVLMFHESFPPKLTPSMSVVSDCPRPEVPTACQQPALWPSEEPGGTVGSRSGHLHNMSWSLKVDVCETSIQTRSSWMELHRTAASLSLALGGRHEIQNGKESWVKSWANQWTPCFSASLAFLRSWIEGLWFGEFWADCCLICLPFSLHVICMQFRSIGAFESCWSFWSFLDSFDPFGMVTDFIRPPVWSWASPQAFEVASGTGKSSSADTSASLDQL